MACLHKSPVTTPHLLKPVLKTTKTFLKTLQFWSLRQCSAVRAKRIIPTNDNSHWFEFDRKKNNSVSSAIESTLISNLVLVSKKTKQYQIKINAMEEVGMKL